VSREITEFVIYIINEIANDKGRTTSQIYKSMQAAGCIKNYLVPHYDVLHTMSSEAVMDDVVQYVSRRGGQL